MGELLRLTFAVEIQDPDDPAIAAWLDKYYALVAELWQPPLSELAQVSQRMRKLRNVVAADELEQWLTKRNVANPRRMAASLMAYLFEHLRQNVLPFYCADWGHPRGECECPLLLVPFEFQQQRPTGPVYWPLASRSMHLKWLVDRDSMAALSHDTIERLRSQHRGTLHAFTAYLREERGSSA